MNLLFVCTGNTCRSPLAEVIGKAEAHARGLEAVSCASAGTLALTGEPAAASSIAVATEHGLNLDNHASQELAPEIVNWADYVIGMAQSHVDGARNLITDVPVCLLTYYLPADHAWYGRGVPDPYDGDFDTYAETYALLECAVIGLFDVLVTEKGLEAGGGPGTTEVGPDGLLARQDAPPVTDH